jgi:Tol biopolymer transport system component
MALNFQDGMTKIMRRPPLIFAVLLGGLSYSPARIYADNLAIKAPLPSPVATVVSAPKLEEHDVLLMNLAINHQLIVTRMSADGSCRSFLNQENSGGFDSVLPSKNQGDDFDATESQDGKWVAFYSNRSGAVNLWICDANGMNQRELTDSDVSIAVSQTSDEPPIQFSPNSKKIAYLNSGNIWTTDLNGENSQSMTQKGGAAAFAWSPDGARIAYLRFGSLRVVAASGLPDDLVVANAYNWPTLCFSPDVKNQAVYLFYNGIWKVDLENKKRDRLYGSFCFPNRIRCNSKGDTLAVLGYSTEGRSEIFQVGTSAGQAPTQLTEGGATAPVYSSDGKFIYFLRSGGLWRIGTQGDKATSIYRASIGMVQPGQLQFTQAVGDCQ